MIKELKIYLEINFPKFCVKLSYNPEKITILLNNCKTKDGDKIHINFENDTLWFAPSYKGRQIPISERIPFYIKGMSFCDICASTVNYINDVIGKFSAPKTP